MPHVYLYLFSGLGFKVGVVRHTRDDVHAGVAVVYDRVQEAALLDENSYVKAGLFKHFSDSSILVCLSFL